MTVRLAALLLLVTVSVCNAFSIVLPAHHHVSSSIRVVGSSMMRQNMVGEPQQGDPETTEETIAEQSSPTKEEDSSTEQESSSVEEQAEQPKQVEDPEFTALKQEIANLESALKARERELVYQQEKLEEYSKAGYARRVAEMETMRRARSLMNSSSRETAMAVVLQNFLPILDDFEQLENKYGNDDFGKSFSALGGAMRSVLKELGVEEYTVQVGDVVNKQRVTVVEEEYSENFPRDTVIRPVAVGMELQGNVMRMAECVASLGSETAEKEKEAEAKGDETAAEEEEAASGETPEEGAAEEE